MDERTAGTEWAESQLKVSLAGGEVRLSLDYAVGPFTVPLTGSASIELSNGDFALTPTGLEVGDIELPDWAVNAVQNLGLEDALAEALAGDGSGSGDDDSCGTGSGDGGTSVELTDLHVGNTVVVDFRLPVD